MNSWCESCASGMLLLCHSCLPARGRRVSQSMAAVPALKPPDQPLLLRQKTPTPITPDDVIQYWFGPKPYELRAVLWLKGRDMNNAQEDAGEEIARVFGPWIRVWGADPTGGEVPQFWQESLHGLVALVILFDEFPRLAFKGAPEMFLYNPLAQRYAAAALAQHEELPWPFQLFCHSAAVQGEDLTSAMTGISGILRVSEELKEDGNVPASSVARTIHKHFYINIAKPAISLLRQFGRDPRQNVLLNRPSTAAELGWLRSKKDIPGWARPPEPPTVLQRVLSRAGLEPEPTQRPRLRILVLHGFPQSAQSFQRLTKKAFAPLREVAELFFAEAPHPASSGMGNKAWWDSVDSSTGGIHYVGLDKSLAYLSGFAASHGPFDGVLGFSQGACLAAILAALSSEETGVLANPRFVIIISGFYCRDSDHLSLHLERSPESHTSSTVEAKRGCIDVPSFHIRGLADAKVEPWRSKVLRECFGQAQEVTHSGGHLSVERWPMSDVAEWLRQFPPSEAACSSRTTPADLVHGINSASRFAARCEALRGLPRLTGGNGVGEPDSPEALFKLPGLRSFSCRMLPPLAPIKKTHGWRQIDANEIVTEAVKQYGEAVLEDLFLLAWHLYPFFGASMAQKWGSLKGDLRPWGPEEGRGFLWLFVSAWALAPQSLREEQLTNLATFESWADLAQLARFAATGAAFGWPDTSVDDVFPDAKLREALLNDIAEVYAHQLHKDNTLAAKVVAEVSADENKNDAATSQIRRILNAKAGRYALPSDCVASAPRFGTAAQRAANLALRVAARLHEIRFGVTVTDREKFRARLDSEYRGVLRRVTHCLDLHSEKRLQELKIQEKQIWSRAFVSDQEFEKMRRSPVSDAIVNPLPEPVEIAPQEELTPLYEFLSSSKPLQPNTLGDMTFDRGTVTTDNRLDLCKQVIGPAGITGLFDALAKDRSSQQHVQHILLGNNICGHELPHKVAEYIRLGNSQLTTWYIAGNRLTGGSLAPLCDALENDKQVRQLWLKRNPLKVEGARLIANCLCVNSYLQVLDVSFCGLMDDGATAIVNGLSANTALRHLYLDANGLSKYSAEQLGRLLGARDARIQTLSVGLNRLYDEGAQILASALACNQSVTRFCIASCGVGTPGVEALANTLKDNCTLVELDIGFLKATAATSELPNRMLDRGCITIAKALSENTTLLALKVTHNGVGLAGRQALRDALCSDSPNQTLVALEMDQIGMPRGPQILRDEVATALLRNLSRLSDVERENVQSLLKPHHLSEIASVYRLGNLYSPGPAIDA